MLSADVVKLLNDQVNKELYSAYLYLDFSNYYTDHNLDGFANWFKIQAQEERDHAMLFMQYLQNNGIAVKLTAIDAPDVDIKDLKTPLTASLAHEQYVTASINTIYAAADAAKDYRTMQFLSWFIAEQGEEEKNADELIKRYEIFGNDPRALYVLNGEVSARTYAPPSLVL